MNHIHPPPIPESPIPLSSRFQSGRVMTLAAGHMVHDTYGAFLAPLLPAFIAKFSLSITGAGLLSVFLQGPSLIQPTVGRMADRYNLKTIVLWSPALASIFMSLLGIAPNYFTLALLLTFAGCIAAGMHSIGPIMTGNVSGDRLGQGMSYWMVGGEMGRTLGPIIVVSVVAPLSLGRMVWLMPFGVLISLFLSAYLKEIPYHHNPTQTSLPWKTALAGMGVLFKPLIVFIFLRAFLHSAVTIYLPTYLTQQGKNLWFAGASLTILQAAGVAGALLSGSLSDRWGRKVMLLIAVVFAPLASLAFLATQNWLQIVLVVLIGFFVISPTPVIMALVQESFPENRSFANGVYMGLSFVIRSLAIVLVGIMGDYLGLETAIKICAAMMFAGLPVIFLLPKKRAQNRGSSRNKRERNSLI